MLKFSGCSHTTSGLIAATPKRHPASLSMTNPSKTKIEIHSVCSTHTRAKQYEYHSLQFRQIPILVGILHWGYSGVFV